MTKIIMFLALALFLISTASACSDNNEFTIGEDIEICTGDCLYRPSDLSDLIACDNTIFCYFSASLPNGTIIISRENMVRDSQHFKYNGTENFTQPVNYGGKVECLGGQGWADPVDFEISLMSIVSSGPAGSGGAFQTPIPQKVVEIPSPTIKERFFGFLAKIKALPRFYFMIFFIAGSFIILTYLDLKKRKIKKIAKEVEKMMFKGGVRRKW